MIVFLIAFSVSFIITFTILPWLIRKFAEKGIDGIDMNKRDKPRIPEMGGISVLIGLICGFYVQIFIFEFLGLGIEINSYLMCSLMTIIGIGLVGIIDDLLELRQSTKAFLPFIFALPLGIYVNSEMTLPFLGVIDFGILMLFLVPFAVTCASNSTNMLEGFNGLSTGLCIIISISLSFIAIVNNDIIGLYFLFPLLGSLLAFWIFNKFPAKIFPGDTLTMTIGSVIACSAISSNLRLEGLILLSPMILEFFLKLRGRFSAQSFATGVENGILIYEGKIQSLTHVLMVNFSLTEKNLVYIFLFFEIVLGFILCLLSYYNFI